MKRPAFLVVIALVGCGSTATSSQPGNLQEATGPRPPVAAQRPYQVKSPNGDRNDPYYWLRDDTRKDPAVLGYLQRRERLHQGDPRSGQARSRTSCSPSCKRHVKEDDATRAGAATTATGTTRGSRPGRSSRSSRGARARSTRARADRARRQRAGARPRSSSRSAGARSAATASCWRGPTTPSVAASTRCTSRTSRTGKLLPDTATNIAATVVWANDNQTVFYVGKDATTLREDRVFRHALGEPTDALVFQRARRLVLRRRSRRPSRAATSRSSLGATTNSEVRLIDADQPRRRPRRVLPREQRSPLRARPPRRSLRDPHATPARRTSGSSRSPRPASRRPQRRGGRDPGAAPTRWSRTSRCRAASSRPRCAPAASQGRDRAGQAARRSSSTPASRPT